MAGSLEAGRGGQVERRDLEAALAARDRGACGAVAPAHGLYLAKVDYAPLRAAIQ